MSSSTRREVDDTATLLGWECRSHGTYVRGEYCIQVDYSSSGSIISAARYYFFKINDMQLRERAVGKHKKAEVMSWLAE